MIRFWLLFCISFVQVPGLWGQQPEKVRSITRAMHPISWYEAQSAAWEKALAQNPKQPAGWQNYYEANRALRNLGGTHRPLDEILEEIKTAVPESFEYHYLRYRNISFSGANQAERFRYLKEAEAIAPNRQELLEEFVSHYELTWDPAARKRYNQLRYQRNDIPEGVLAFNYNVLMSLPPKALLFTNGDNDTYPLWLLQDVMEVRTDVIVLNRSLAYEQRYLNRLLQHYGIPPFEREIQTQADWKDYHPALRQHLLLFSKRPLCYSTTVHPDAYANIKDKLYLVGLAFEYSSERFDNEQRLANNIEQKFLLDRLQQGLTHVPPESPEHRFLQAYFPPLLTLRRYYLRQGETVKAQECKRLLLDLARRTNKESEILQALN